MNKKGFSLIELLTTVVILGIIAGIAIISVNKILEQSKAQYYETTVKSINLAAKSYIDDNRSLRPKEDGSCVILHTSTLITHKYLDPIKDATKTVCLTSNDRSASYIKITRQNIQEYNYEVVLKCGNYDNSSNITTTNCIDAD